MNTKKHPKDALYKIFELSLIIDVSHDFANLFLAWGSAHLREHHTNHFLVDWRILFKLFLEEVSSD